eukprot:952275-Amphidinium_carterae.1
MLRSECRWLHCPQGNESVRPFPSINELHFLVTSDAPCKLSSTSLMALFINLFKHCYYGVLDNLRPPFQQEFAE